MPAILVIENDSLEMDFIRSVIREEFGRNYAVLTAHTGAQGIRSARHNDPKMILMDVLLPDMDGTDAIREMRQFLPNSCITILTACTDFYCAQKAISLRVYEYLLKPIKPHGLKSVLRQMERLSLGGPFSERGAEAASPALPQQISRKTQIPFIEEALRYIQAHYEEKLSLEDIGKRFYINGQYFSRVFKRETGMTFTEYINSLRVEAACGLLAATNYPAYRIANECGFSDPSYFNRVFLKYKETTPQKYRRMRQEDPEETGGLSAAAPLC